MSDGITVKQAAAADIPIIEDILLDALNWLDRTGKQMWIKSQITWGYLSTRFSIHDFSIAFMNDIPVGCMALVDADPVYWRNIQKGESLFIHQLAVKRVGAGQGVSTALIDYAKTQATLRGMGAVRLDCNQSRKKLRELYEREGFVCVEEKLFFEQYYAAMYVWRNRSK